MKLKEKSKKKTSSRILVPSTEIITPDNPFDYLTSLKRGGLKSTHGEDFDPAALASSRTIISAGSYDDAEIDIARQIRETVDSKIIVPKDMKIDDGDLPTAANFYEWVTEDRFGAVDEERPFLEQLIWGIVTFNDACPRCTDNEWLYHTHKVDDSYRKFERKVALMHHGVCPHCKMGRSEMVTSGQMKFINELAVNAGQRCVIGSTPVLTEFGVLRISECAPDADYYFSELEIKVHNGIGLETTSDFYRAKPEKIYRITLSNGVSIAGTADHPIKTSNGFEKLGELAVGAIVPVSYGQRCFGPNTFESAFRVGAQFNAPEVGKSIRTSNITCVQDFLRGMFQSKERAFLSLLAISDISALLFNLGIYHSIDGPAICLSDDGFASLHADGLETLPAGSELEFVTSISVESEQDTFDFTLPITHQFVTGGILSHNSGKSHTIGGYLYPYLTHRMLMLQKPAQFYRLARTTVLHATFVALTYAQAKDTLWTPFYGAILSSQWFQQYHAMLRFYENKYGESLLKLNDTFVVYKPRGLMVYPAGPDKRVLRGRTRYGACYTANTLVSTNQGLIKIDDKDLIGMRAIRGSKPREITNWSKTKWATDVVKVNLANGMTLEVTSDHKVLTLGRDLKTKKTMAANLKGRYVGVTLGGEFPEELQLHYDNAQKKDTLTDRYVALMCKLGTFFKSDLESSGLPNMAGLNSVLAKLAAENVIKKTSTGCRKPYIFTMLASAETCLDIVKGKGKQTQHKYDFVAPIAMSDELAYLLGCMVADGSYKTDQEFTYTTASLDKAETFAAHMHNVFGVDLRIATYKYANEQKGPCDYYRINMGTKAVKEYFRFLGLAKGAAAHSKTIPWSILEGSREHAISFINAGFCTDGGLRNLKHLYYSSRHKVLAQQYQMLLARCGYATRIRIHQPDKLKQYDVVLTRESSARFLDYDYHGFVKRDAQGDYRDLFLRSKKYRAAEFHIPYTNECFSVRAGFGKPTKEGFDQNIIWVRVDSLEALPDQWVYDITVNAKDHMFTANSVVASNSIDEIAYFDSQKDSTKVKINAHEVYDAMTNSLYTLRAAAERLINNGSDDVFPGYSMNVTSPVARNDMIHTLLARAKDSESMYGIHRPTWEVNPDFPRNSRLIIEAYRKDPDSAEKNFGANPPLIANPFISNHDLIAGAEDRDRKNAVKVVNIMKTSRKQGQSYMYGEVKKVKKSGHASMMAIDAGLTDNSFAMAGGRPLGLNLQIDFATEIVPVKGFKINHSLVYSEVILPIMEARNCKILLADRWNSIKLLDDAKLDMGDPADDDDTFIAQQYSLKYKDMVSVRTCLEQGILRLPKSEIKVSSLLEVLDSEYRDFYDGKPIAHLFKQLHTIKDLEKQVGKGDGYTDDIWRAMALLVWGLMEEEFQGILLSEPVNYEKVRPTAIGFSRLYSGGGGTVGQGGGQATLINGAPLGVMARAKR